MFLVLASLCASCHLTRRRGSVFFGFLFPSHFPCLDTPLTGACGGAEARRCLLLMLLHSLRLGMRQASSPEGAKRQKWMACSC